MRERPIIFSGAMVRAILDGRKTQTRRASTMRGADRAYWHIGETHAWKGKPPQHYEGWVAEVEKLGSLLLPLTCPFGVAGDRLWVREAFSIDTLGAPAYPVWYWADGNPSDGDWTKPKPSIHMPRWASRLTLEITRVRVERLSDITEADAKAEGIAIADVDIRGVWYAGPNGAPYAFARDAYIDLWNTLNAKRGYGWGVNPWVWVIEFRPTEIPTNGKQSGPDALGTEAATEVSP